VINLRKELDRFKQEKKDLLQTIRDQKDNIDLFEKELISTKQKLGDVLNEMSEYENLSLASERAVQVNNQEKRGLFKKKSKK
jgi:hypothetical protein